MTNITEEIIKFIKDISIFLWLAIAGLVMFVFSIDGASGYLNLWLITFLYGLWAFVVDKFKEEHRDIGNFIHILLLLIYSFIVVNFFIIRFW